MKSDSQLRRDVLAELDWDPSLHAEHVGVAVHDGVVQLSGHLATFAEKQAVERAVARVAGVKAMAIELEVQLDPRHQRSDAEIAAAIETGFEWHALIPHDRLQVKVEKGWVTLTGQVDWHFQRHNAEVVARAVTGVVGLNNRIELRHPQSAENVARRIREALARQAEQEADRIEVVVDGDTALLRGTVATLDEREAAQTAAWSAPGIARVVNELRVSA